MRMKQTNSYMLDLTIKTLAMHQKSGMGAGSLSGLTDTLHANMEQMSGDKIKIGDIPVADAIRGMNGSSPYHHLLPESEIKTDY